MKCIECKWYAGQTNDTYGVCKRYPQTANKSQHDWCGEYADKRLITPSEKVEYQYDIHTDEMKPKRGRKPKV